jgi:hypothetical protein
MFNRKSESKKMEMKKDLKTELKCSTKDFKINGNTEG